MFLIIHDKTNLRLPLQINCTSGPGRLRRLGRVAIPFPTRQVG